MKWILLRDILFFIKTFFSIHYEKDVQQLERRLRFINDIVSDERADSFPCKNIIKLYEKRITKLKKQKIIL